MSTGAKAHRAQEAIAVVGAAGRFPGAASLDAFWELLRSGREGIRFFDEATLLARGVPRRLLKDPDFVPAGGELDDADLFDADFFGLSAREAALIDPQQRLMLECAWHAFEDACLVPGETGGTTAVFASIGPNSYLGINLANAPDAVLGAGFDMVRVANRLDNAATRLSYKLGLDGPSMTVQTGCSSSLVAVHLAMQSLLSGECDTALVIGCRFSVGRGLGYRYVEHGVLSPDGHVRAFDASARGMVGGDGVAAVVLRREEDAVAERDPVRALLLGSAVNNDGAGKLGYTAPSVAGQTAVIVEAHRIAGVDPGSIGAVEAHGTGTELGDPVEVAALARAFGAAAPGRKTCALGSVKTNIGHLDAAAGVAGLIKMVLQLENRTLAPSLHFREPNPKLGLAATPFHVITRTQAWVADGPLRGGVSSFGIGGTNAHVVLEEAPRQKASASTNAPGLLVFSARSEAALATLGNRLADRLSSGSGSLTDLAWTSQTGRAAMPFRSFVTATSKADAAAKLSRGSAGTTGHVPGSGPPQLWFMFPGQGEADPGPVAHHFYASQPRFRQMIDRLQAAAAGRFDLHAALLDRESGEPENAGWPQPALFAFGMAACHMWTGFGLRPGALIGHSLGEWTAACAAGLLPPEDMLQLILTRAELLASAEPGAMAAVAMSETAISARLPGNLDIAAINGPRLAIVSGRSEDLDAFTTELRGEGVAARRLPVGCAFHSALLDPILPRLRTALANAGLKAPSIPIWSPLNQDWLSPRQACDPDYWCRQTRQTVRWSDAISTIAETAPGVFLEVGPAETLTRLSRQISARVDAVATVAGAAPLDAVGQLWVRGVEPDWTRLHGGPRPRLRGLPSYPFARNRHWIEPERKSERPSARLEPRDDPSDWFWVPSWRRGAPLTGETLAVGDWLVTAGPLAESLHEASVVSPDPAQARDEAWWRAQFARQRPTGLVLDWTAEDRGDVPLEDSALTLRALALAARDPDGEGIVQIAVVTRGACDPTGDARPVPGRSAPLSMLTVMQQEVPGLVCRAIDLGSGATPRDLVREVVHGVEARVALRNGCRWIATYASLPLPGTDATLLKRDGHYLITGANGRIGRQLARHLQSRFGARLSLLARGGQGAPPGGTVFQQTVDCADATALAEAVELAERRNGPLDGVFHLAGKTRSYSSLRDMDASHVTGHLLPKTVGVEALGHALGARPLDFIALFSSVSTAVGGYGYGAQVIANGYLNAFAEAANAAGDHRWRAIAWEGWQFGPADASGAEAAQLALAPEDGLDALERALIPGELPCIYVSTADLTARIKRFASPSPAPVAPKQVSFAETDLSDTEQALAELWSRLVGPVTQGRDSDFFAMGGHSLMATQMCAQIRERFDVELPLSLVFEHPTLGELAQALEDAILSQIEALSEDEAEAILCDSDAPV